jgi:hypothetical protein
MTAVPADPFSTADHGPAPEVDISLDLLKRGLIVAPVLIAVCGVIWGADGAWSSAYAIAIVLANFLLAAYIIATTAKISLGLMMGATLFGYLIRLGLIFLAVWMVKDAGWISFPALGATIIVTHLGLLAWELKYVALTLTSPGLKPPAPTPYRPTDLD